MKFSASKKAQMKKRRQKRINRAYSYTIGLKIYNFRTDSEQEVIDETQINKVRYLLTESDKQVISIYKIVDVGKYVKLSTKRLLEKKHNFEMPENWEKKTEIAIYPNGVIVVK